MTLDPVSRQRMLAALGHRSRVRIVLQLMRRDRCITELAGLVELSQSCTTRHVQALERAGWVTNRRDGKRVRIAFAGDSAEASALIAWLTGQGERRRRAARGLAQPVPETPSLESGNSVPVEEPLAPAPRPRSEPMEDYLL